MIPNSHPDERNPSPLPKGGRTSGRVTDRRHRSSVAENTRVGANHSPVELPRLQSNRRIWAPSRPSTGNRPETRSGLKTKTKIKETPSTKTAGVIEIEGRLIYKRSPDTPACTWIGQEEPFRLLTAALLSRGRTDPAMSPVLVGPPGCGKTTLACAVAAAFDLPIFLMNCSSDMRPEDLLVTPVLGSDRVIRYQASGLVSAAVSGGICILDEANRMNEKAWASLASLLDDRHYVDSVITGVKLFADPSFRLVATMNSDSSTFGVPDYVSSRLRPTISIKPPGREELAAIVKANVPGASVALREEILSHLENAVESGQLGAFSIRDAVQIARYATKHEPALSAEQAIQITLGHGLRNM